MHSEIRADDAFDSFLDLLLQGLGEAADENVIRNVGVVEPMKGDGMTEAPRDDRIEKRKARLMDIGRGDVPVVKGTFGVPALAPPRADTLARQLRPDALGLLVGVRLDIPAVGAMAMSPVCVPSSSSRSTNSPSHSALASARVVFGTCESSASSNSSLLPSRSRPCWPMRTILSGVSWRTSLTV